MSVLRLAEIEQNKSDIRAAVYVLTGGTITHCHCQLADSDRLICTPGSAVA